MMILGYLLQRQLKTTIICCLFFKNLKKRWDRKNIQKILSSKFSENISSILRFNSNSSILANLSASSNAILAPTSLSILILNKSCSNLYLFASYTIKLLQTLPKLNDKNNNKRIYLFNFGSESLFTFQKFFRLLNFFFN